MQPDELQAKKYINVETYKRNGEPVQTPVWFFVKDDKIFVVTRSKTGKMKRIKNNPKVRIAECTIKGHVTGRWTNGTATVLDGTETGEAVKARNKKYGLAARVMKFLTGSKGDLVAFSIILD